ncbi:uncharacterized protein LOC141908914 [Tubulanus polymorphus]|uniref:uncharacterized protein LOC141908914 n=1 Tax=Tubulanus polymorphus TaxID=672921 RepID=UPI003DA5081B
MAVEAQRVIAVSLGKIASSRQKRTGVDLHKNLLVSGVLQKARSQLMIETYRAAVQAQQQKEIVLKQAPVEELTPIEHEEMEDKENAPPAVYESDSDSDEFGDDDCFEPPASCQEDELSNRSNDNALEAKDVNILEIGALPTCGKCVKRRHSDIGEWEEENLTPVKKTKCSEYDYDSECDENSPKEYTELEVPQLSSLVTIFNTGFTGLVNNMSSINNNTDSSSISSNNSSCSISIRNTFDSITRPILAVAMSV